eukprot:TRINITY_DN7690_c0_g1_i2.p1 TRINITY_DN7690_c0_g1~~TRINITY_DN7690_c0_g1_i2.p1  ORF type:complete len:311 (-),score=96.48 TRINITY_DN7690_c0_g1_i2:21-953(-)
MEDFSVKRDVIQKKNDAHLQVEAAKREEAEKNQRQQEEAQRKMEEELKEKEEHMQREVQEQKVQAEQLRIKVEQEREKSRRARELDNLQRENAAKQEALEIQRKKEEELAQEAARKKEEKRKGLQEVLARRTQPSNQRSSSSESPDQSSWPASTIPAAMPLDDPRIPHMVTSTLPGLVPLIPLEMEQQTLIPSRRMLDEGVVYRWFDLQPLDIQNRIVDQLTQRLNRMTAMSNPQPSHVPTQAVPSPIVSTPSPIASTPSPIVSTTPTPMSIEPTSTPSFDESTDMTEEEALERAIRESLKEQEEYHRKS